MSTTRPRTVLTTLLSALVLTLLGGASPAAATAPDCALTWGSLPESGPAGPAGDLTDVRAGQHDCFDRLVLDVSADSPGYFVRYVPEVHRDGSGDVVPVRGGARLEVVVIAPPIATNAWFLPNGELVDTSAYRTFRHVAWAGAFEGQSTIGLGVRARLPFRVFTLDGPGTGSRLVLDVAHRW